MPCQMYNYFEPDIVAVLNDSMASVKPVDKAISKKVKTPHV